MRGPWGVWEGQCTKQSGAEGAAVLGAEGLVHARPLLPETLTLPLCWRSCREEGQA